MKNINLDLDNQLRKHFRDQFCSQVSLQVSQIHLPLWSQNWLWIRLQIYSQLILQIEEQQKNNL